MPAKLKINLSPVEIALIRRAIPYMERHMPIPQKMKNAVAKRGSLVAVKPEVIQKIRVNLTKGPVLLRLRGSTIVVRLASKLGLKVREGNRKRR